MNKPTINDFFAYSNDDGTISVYQAFTKDEALYELDKLEEKWGKKYPYIFKI